ncbi:MAG TPA: ABC transporter substrate-binding protein [Phototrophicaceae bacterium]|nr:ABC transporter substrate-binding protein [Phototrophicaceae bacterium]
MSRHPARLALLSAAVSIALVACGATAPEQPEDAGAPSTGEPPAASGETVVACGDPVEGFAVTHDKDGNPLPERTGGTTGGLLTAPTTAAVADDHVEPVTTDPQPRLPVTVESCDGAVVEITDTSRILAVDLYGTLAEIVFSLGLGDQVVGRDRSTGFPEAADLPLVTPGAHDLNAEAILALDPSVVLTDATIGPNEVQLQLRDAGIPVVFFDDTRSMDTIPTHIRAVAGALGVPEAGEELVTRTQEEITAALDETPTTAEPPSIAFLYLRGGMIQLLGGPGSGADSLIRAIGGRDTGTEVGLERPFTQISAETMISVQPDVLLLMSAGLESVGGPEGLTAVPGLAQTEAVQDGRIVDMSDTVLLSFGPRTGRAVRALAEAVYE